jgi:hypothetical protein
VIVIASIPFLRPLFVDTNVFKWTYYRSLLAKHSQKSRSTSGKERRESEESDDTFDDKGGRPLKSLPRIPKDRFISTTVKNAGMESDFDRLSYIEHGEAPPRR